MSFVGPKALFFHHLVFVSVSLALFCSTKDTLSPGSSIADSDSPETLVSSDETFELGFFSPTNSSRRYVGVWYKNIADPTVVWVANRENPISNRTGILTIESDGNLVILVGNVPVWTSNVTTPYSNSSVGLEADGNLILFQPCNPQPCNPQSSICGFLCVLGVLE